MSSDLFLAIMNGFKEIGELTDDQDMVDSASEYIKYGADEVLSRQAVTSSKRTFTVRPKQSVYATTYVEDMIKEIRGMHVNYKGRDPQYRYRVAEIDWNDEISSGKGADEVIEILEADGWNVDRFDGYCLAEVDSEDEYSIFKDDYKKAKAEAIERLKHQKSED